MSKKTKKIFIGDVPVGGGAPISIQSMTTKESKNIEAVVDEILILEKAGCDIVRLAVNNEEDAKALKAIKEKVNIPLVADIQFDYKLGIYAIENSCDCLRINPGNIGSKEKVKVLADYCKDYNIPIRIGVNSGSISKKIIDKFGGVNTDSLVASALEEIEVLESFNFDLIKVSIKSSDVRTMIEANRKISDLIDYPLHLGVTEAGPVETGTIKSSIGIGSLLNDGIGDTIRVSLTSSPVEEIRVAKSILKSLNLLEEGINLISCPTCSRTQVDLIEIVNKAQDKLQNVNKNANIAIMGCPVNGPGEAKEADLGVACGKGYGLIFKKGKVERRVDEKDILSSLLEEVDKL